MNFVFFADVTGNEIPDPVGPMSPMLKERLAMVGAIGLVFIIVVSWAILSRHSRRRAARREEHRQRRHSLAKNTSKNLSEIKQYVEQRKKRRHRRDHRPRNPTLAETGGLPPVRRDDESSSPSQSR